MNSSGRSPNSRFRLLAAVVLLACMAGSSAAGQTIWELTPYRMQLLVSVAPTAELTPRLRSELAGDLIQRCEALIGAAWDIADLSGSADSDERAGQEHAAMLRTLIRSFKSADAGSIPRQSLSFDKVMLVTVSPAEVGYRVTAREFDVRTRMFGSPITVPAWQLGKLRDAALRAMVRAFAPLARIESVGDRQVRVQVLLAAAEGDEPTPPWQDELLADLAGRHQWSAGDPWDVTPAAAPRDLRRSLLAEMEAVTVESLPPESLFFDKVVLLAVSPGAQGYQVTARELDVRNQRQWSTPFALRAGTLGEVRGKAWEAMFEVTAPLPGIERAVDREVVLRLKAGVLPPPDRQLLGVRPDDVFLPVTRFDDQHGNLQRVSTLPWTFLSVRAITPRALACRLHTGLRTSLTGRRRGRVQQLALAVVPPQGPTTLVLQERASPEELEAGARPRPLAGYEVFAHPPNSKTTLPIGRSDRRGRVVVPPGENPLRVLMVRNGGQTLVRLPMVPGLQRELSAAVPNDDQRLAVEGFVTGLQEQLVDLVTRRQVLLVRAAARIDAAVSDKKEGKSAEAAEKLEEAEAMLVALRELERSQESLAKLLERERARSRPVDSRTRQKIDELFDDTETLFQQHPGDDSIEEIETSLETARTTTGIFCSANVAMTCASPRITIARRQASARE